MKNVKCSKCGWVHFQVSAAYIRRWKSDWVVFWNGLSEEWRENHGTLSGPPTEEAYLSCHRCGGSYKNFEDAKDEDVPFGSTINPVMDRNEIYED